MAFTIFLSSDGTDFLSIFRVLMSTFWVSTCPFFSTIPSFFWAPLSSSFLSLFGFFFAFLGFKEEFNSDVIWKRLHDGILMWAYKIKNARKFLIPFRNIILRCLIPNILDLFTIVKRQLHWSYLLKIEVNWKFIQKPTNWSSIFISLSNIFISRGNPVIFSNPLGMISTVVLNCATNSPSRS